MSCGVIEWTKKLCIIFFFISWSLILNLASLCEMLELIIKFCNAYILCNDPTITHEDHIYVLKIFNRERRQNVANILQSVYRIRYVIIENMSLCPHNSCFHPETCWNRWMLRSCHSLFSYFIYKSIVSFFQQKTPISMVAFDEMRKLLSDKLVYLLCFLLVSIHLSVNFSLQH